MGDESHDTDAFENVQRAWQILGNPETRAAYDARVRGVIVYGGCVCDDDDDV